MPAIIVRDAAADDAAAIARVHAASWQAAYRGIVDDDRLDRMSVDEREQRWRERLTGPLNGFTIVGERERSLMLWVFADNHGARAFYAGFGFEPVAELTGSMGIPIVQLKAGLAA